MPLIIPSHLPAISNLAKENIRVLSSDKSEIAHLPRLNIGVLNLMPLKEETETDVIRLLSNSPLLLELTFIHFKSHKSKNTAQSHIDEFYTDFDSIKEKKFDGLIITGAPIEHLSFEEVTYWSKLKEVMDWSSTHVRSTLHICWAAQAGLYYRYGIHKKALDKKMFGVFEHYLTVQDNPLVRGFDSRFYVPHSRHTTIDRADILQCSKLQILSESVEAGVYLVMANKGKEIYVTGHSEYPALRLDGEYRRDLAKNLPIDAPLNYYKDNNPKNSPMLLWQSHANLLFMNWINYFVNPNTPY